MAPRARYGSAVASSGDRTGTACRCISRYAHPCGLPEILDLTERDEPRRRRSRRIRRTTSPLTPTDERLLVDMPEDADNSEDAGPPRAIGRSPYRTARHRNRR